MNILTVQQVTAKGRKYCQTEGSAHYKGKELIEPLELMISHGVAEDFCIGNMIKYATRFKKTRKLDDLRKVSHYAQILCGIELSKSPTT